MYSSAALTEHVSGVFELEMKFGLMMVALVLLLEIMEYLLILAFVKPNHQSSIERHQCYIFQINFVYSLMVLSML